ncbi:hypothetical protein GCM10027098_38200 [Bowmanella dokdonensis]
MNNDAITIKWMEAFTSDNWREYKLPMPNATVHISARRKPIIKGLKITASSGILVAEDLLDMM